MVNKFSVAWISLTYNCNNRCRWCYASSNELKVSRELNRNQISPILGLLNKLEVKRTILIGGEPTIYPHLEEVLEEHQRYKLKTGIVTNGRKLKDKKFSQMLKSRGIDSLTISIEGYDSLSHDEVTQVQGSYRESINGIYTATEEGIRASTNTVITKNNISCLEKIASSLISHPLEHIGFNICGPCFGSNEPIEVINPSVASEEFQKVYDYIKANSNKQVKLVTPMPLCFFDKEHREEFKERRFVRGGPCQLSSGSNFVIDYNGDVVPCTHLTGYPLFNIFKEGRVISKEDFLGQMNTPQGIPFKFRKMMSKNASEKCDDGNCNEPCSGGCPLFWSVFDPNKEIKGLNS